MNQYVIVCDSSCDLSEEQISKRGIYCVQLSFRFNGENEMKCMDMSPDEFYSKMRNGLTAKTSGANTHEFMIEFEKLLKNGLDIIYIGFSSALSMTFSSASIASNKLRKKYPQRKIALVDSLCASAGIALLVDSVLKRKSENMSFDDAVSYANETAKKICHWFTVNDLEYLKRGGRISPSSAFFGNMLGIKPLLHVDDNGRLEYKSKVRGRHSAIMALSEIYSKLHCESNEVYISHADCPSDAELLARTLQNESAARVSLITNIGPVIGAHAGPGTLALFFKGKER